MSDRFWHNRQRYISTEARRLGQDLARYAASELAQLAHDTAGDYRRWLVLQEQADRLEVNADLLLRAIPRVMACVAKAGGDSTHHYYKYAYGLAKEVQDQCTTAYQATGQRPPTLSDIVNLTRTLEETYKRALQ